jgi:hypothetical protein
MNRVVNMALGVVALAAAAGPAFSQTSASVTTTGTITVVSPLALTKATDLAFGSIVRPSAGSNTILINAASGTRSIQGGGNGALTSSASTRAAYSVQGEGGQSFSITIPSSLSMTRAGGGETLPVTLTASSASGALSGALGDAGAATFGVGGALSLDSNAVAGTYSGTFNVTIGYN